MRRSLFLIILLVLPLALAACAGPAPNTAPININKVLDRISKTLVSFDAYLRRYDYKSVDDAMFAQFNRTIEHDLNKKPRFHRTRIVTKVRKDASIVGYEDRDGDRKPSQTEPRVFKIEFDPDNNRIIVTSADYGKSVGQRMSGSGFFAGVMIGSILNRQSRAGYKHGHFNNRKVAGAPAGRKVASKSTSRSRRTARGSVARSRARSGGVRSGK